MDFLRNDYRNVNPKKRSKSGWIETYYHQKELLKKSYASVVVIGKSIVAGLRRYPTVWRNFILRYKTINLGIGGDRIDEIIVGMVAIARSISHRYPDIEVIVSGLLPRDIHWSTRRVKINKTNDYLKDLRKIRKNDFHAPRPRLDFARQFSKHGTIF